MSINDFVKMTILLCLISFSVYAKTQPACRNGRKMFSLKSARWLCIPWEPNILLKLLYLVPFLRPKQFCILLRISRWPPKMVEKCFLANTLWAKIALSCTISKITALLCFLQNFKMAAKNSGRTILGKKCHMTPRISWGPKISQKSL